MEEWDHALSTLELHMQDVVSQAASCRPVCYCMLKSSLLCTAGWNPVCYCWLKSSLLSTAGWNPICYCMLKSNLLLHVEIQFLECYWLKSSLWSTASWTGRSVRFVDPEDRMPGDGRWWCLPWALVSVFVDVNHGTWTWTAGIFCFRMLWYRKQSLNLLKSK